MSEAKRTRPTLALDDDRSSHCSLHDDRLVTREGERGPRADDDGAEWAVVGTEARADVGDDFARVERGEQRARIH